MGIKVHTLREEEGKEVSCHQQSECFGVERCVNERTLEVCVSGKGNVNSPEWPKFRA